MNHNAMLNAVFKEVRACCSQILQAYDRLASPHISKQDKLSFTKTIDKDVQDTLIQNLKNIYPRHYFVGEEESFDMDKAFEHNDLWIIDPIDGSFNFTHNIPFFAISICYYYQGKPRLALVYDPIHDELFTAIENKGAQLNQHRIEPGKCQTLSESVCGVESHSLKKHALLENVHRIRRIGCTSLTLCYAACGRFDIAVCELPKIWDMAAGYLIATEAGAKSYNGDNKPYTHGDQYLCVSNRKLFEQVEKCQ